MLIFVEDNSAVNILLAVVVIMITMLITYLLIRGIKTERLKYLSISHDRMLLTLDEFTKVLTRHISAIKDNQTLSVLQIDICDTESLIRVCGSAQLKDAIDSKIKILKQVLPTETKFCLVDSDKILISINKKFDNQMLDNLLQIVLHEMRKAVVLAGAMKVEFDCNLSGILYVKGDGNVETLLSNLDMTSIESKRKGRNKYVIFSHEIATTSTEEYSLFKELQEAIAKKDFRIFYQPIVDLQTLEVYSLEALLRWQHSVKGIISPESFMPTLEHSGDMHWVGLWAFEEIVKQLDFWKANNTDLNIKINVNWSMGQLSNPSLYEEVRKILKKYKAEATDFIFEIPNYSVAETVEAVNKNLDIFRQLGIMIAVDNYGLEISTLSLLDDNTNINVIKLNRAFCSKLETNKIIQNIATMLVNTSRERNMILIAEGIEDEAMLTYIKEVGLKYGQGYHFAKPKTPSEAMAEVLLTPWKD